jgi:hypothetical protein
VVLLIHGLLYFHPCPFPHPTPLCADHEMFDFLVQHVTLWSTGVIFRQFFSLFRPNASFFLSSVGRPSLWITERKEIPPSPFSFLLSQTSRKNCRDSALPNGSASFWPEIRDFGGIHSLPGAKFVSQSRVFSVNSVNDFSFPELILVSCVLARSWRVVVRGGC